MITIPLEIGDVILAGRFKNKKITVKEIGSDEFGLPTVNGRGIMKIRIQKMMPKKESLLRKLIREEIENLHERDITDPKIEKAIEDLAKLQEQLSAGLAQMEALKKQLNISGLEKQVGGVMNDIWGLFEEMKKDGDRLARTKNVIMTIQRDGAERETFSYEKALDFAMTQVNQDVQFKILNELKITQKFTRVKPGLAFSKTESIIRESKIGDFFLKIGNYLKSLLPKFQSQGKKIDANLNKLEQMIA